MHGRPRPRAMSRAAALGNTPAVCRRSYIDPELVDRVLRG